MRSRLALRLAERRPGFFGVLLALAFAMGAAQAGAAEHRHGLSAFGELKYPADFKHFEWVNPDAPKGGRLSTIGTSAHQLRQLQRLHPQGRSGAGLRVPVRHADDARLDEPDAVYGLVAQSAEVAHDGCR